MWLKWFPWKFAIRRLARVHGFTDPIVLLSHFGRFAQPSEGMVPIELLREEPANGTLVLGSGVPPRWLDAGHSLSVGPAPTLWGPVEVHIDASREAVLVRWVGRWRQKPSRIEVRVPDCEAATVAGDSDELRVRRLRHREDEPPGKGCAG